jgi:malonyl-CoA O-methyltransferase
MSEVPQELSPREGYAAWAAYYDNDGNPLIPLEGPAMQRLFRAVADLPVLDLGCGTGRHTLALAGAGAKVTALDECPEMLERARAKLDGHDVQWVVHSLPGPLPFAAGTFALAVLGLVAEHIADLDTLLREVARVMRPGGRCLLSALHPERTAQGQRARFIVPATGQRQPITTYHRTIEEYHTAAVRAGLVRLSDETLIVPPELAESLSRAARYVGLPLGWVACYRKPTSRGYRLRC